MFDILVAEDGKSWRDICKEAFDIAGYTCDFAANASDAIEKLETDKYRLVCVNLKLVDYGPGTALLHRLDSHFPDMPVMLVTGYFAGSLAEINERVNRLQKRYPNIKKVLLKGNPDEPVDAFVDALLEGVQDLLEYPSGRVVSWLHLSDLHLKDKSYQQDKVLRQLLEDVKETGWRPDLVVVTGDITFSARPDQYRLASDFFDKLLEITGLPKDALFLVPGNHDVDWGKLDKYRKAVFSEPSEVIEFFHDIEAQEARRYVFSKFESYAEFVNTYLVNQNGEPIRSFDEDHYFYVHTLDIEAGRIVILGLNSAWASALRFDFEEKKADDEGHLWLGEPQIDTALRLAEECKADIVIALMHHPFEWLEKCDCDWVEHPMRKKCSVILHGHLHEAIVGRHIEPGNDVVILGAGTTYEKRDHRNCYCYVSLDLAARKGTAYLRRYSPRRGGGWVPDALSYPAAGSDKVSFDIP